MKDTRRKLNFYSLFDFPKIEKSLEKMALEGWMITDATGNLWKYERIEPKKLKFNVVFLPKVSALDPEPTEQSANLAEYASKTGWKLAVSAAMMQIFYNENENATPMETDPIVQVDSIHKTVKKNLLWSWIVLMAVSLLNVFIRFVGVTDNLINLITDSTQLLLVLSWLVISLESLFHILSYYIWYKKAKNAAENGEFIKPRSNMAAYYSILVILLVITLYLMFRMFSTSDSRIFWLVMGYMAVIFAVVYGIIRLMKKAKIPGKYTLIAVYAIGVIVSFIIMGGIIHLVLSNDYIDEDAAGTYDYNGRLIEYYLDEIPLRVEDMENIDYENYSTRNEVEYTIFAAKSEIRQRGRIGDRVPDLEYTIVDVKMPFLYEAIFNDIWDDRDETNDDFTPEGHKSLYEEVDAAPWKADRAYQLVSQEFGGIDHYILCYGNRIVEMVFYDFSPDEADKASAGEKLIGYAY